MKMNTLDKILLACAIFLVLFTVSMIVIFCIFQTIPDSLVEAVFSLAGSEAIITGVIWYAKKKINSKRETKDDRKTQEP